MRFVYITLLFVSLAAPVFAAETTSLTNGITDSSAPVGINAPPAENGKGLPFEFNQGWETGPSSKGSCEYITISGVDSAHADDFEILFNSKSINGTIYACLLYFGPYYGAYTEPDHINCFIDSDGGSGPYTTYTYPWVPDTWNYSWPYNPAYETLWDAGNYIYTYYIHLTGNEAVIPSSTVFWWAQQYEHNRSGGDQIGTPYGDIGDSYGDESYFASDYFGYTWSPWSTIIGGGPNRIGFVLYGEWPDLGIESASLGAIKASFAE